MAITDRTLIMEAKGNLEIALGHQVHILREILASLKNEHQALKNENYHVLKSFEELRSPLFIAFERWKKVFFDSVFQIDQNINSDEPPPFGESLSLLKEALIPDDIELLMLQEQASVILMEIQDETMATLHFLENQSIPADFRPIKSPEIQLKTFKVAIGLLEPDEDS